MRIVVPPLKSQGIKTKLVPWIQALIPNVAGRWIEPFLGTGVVAFNSGFNRSLLSDTNPHVVRFYKSIQSGLITPSRVRSYLEEEGQALRSAGRNGYDHFQHIRTRFNKNHDPLDFLFLSRAGFNGMMRFNKKGGVEYSVLQEARAVFAILHHQDCQSGQQYCLPYGRGMGIRYGLF